MVNVHGFLTVYLVFITSMKRAPIMMLVAQELAATSKRGTVVTQNFSLMRKNGAPQTAHVLTHYDTVVWTMQRKCIMG
ncbi:MAG TPA: hypothetical protein VE944_05365 [Nostoc sp.]|uniref:hypothetical protein n=1 Tax=Nostoc sp. TaxID=1180 RepID=UPI002D289A99|nr:hypothetical protein [Nostoc sp.]HYX13793.1 hypothetical protein [Nostoc sp.]